MQAPASDDVLASLSPAIKLNRAFACPRLSEYDDIAIVREWWTVMWGGYLDTLTELAQSMSRRSVLLTGSDPVFAREYIFSRATACRDITVEG